MGLVLVLSGGVAFAAGGLFPKMPTAAEVNVVDCQHDSAEAKKTARALEGLVNQSGAEVYLLSRPEDQGQLNASGKGQIKLPPLPGDNPGLRTLFKNYSGRVKKMFIYDPAQDWTFYLAVMASAQQSGIPVTESTKNILTSEFGWNGEVEDFRSRWNNRIEAYNWALTELMPGCSQQVVFVVNQTLPLIDYVVASKGFVFWLDFKKDDEGAEINKIFASHGYTVGTSLMGYGNSGDKANQYANKYGIGYVVSDFYANGSFWSSFPNKTYQQAAGAPTQALPGKIYVALFWSDGDNLQFDQRGLYALWHESDRGAIPVATTLGPALQELNTPLLDWYYSNMTANDELIAGPCGMQFIYGRDYDENLFPAWCDKNKVWMADAGFHTACTWVMPYPGKNFATYIKTCGLAGIIDNGSHGHFPEPYRMDFPIVDQGGENFTEQQLFDSLSKHAPNADGPVFIAGKCIVEAFLKGGGGYAKIKRVVDRLNAAYPGRYVFMLPKDFFATIRNYHPTFPASSPSDGSSIH